MKYIALERGFIDGARVRKGETFEAENFKGKWAKPANKVKPDDVKDELPTPEKIVEAVQGKKPAKKRGKKKS